MGRPARIRPESPGPSEAWTEKARIVDGRQRAHCRQAQNTIALQKEAEI
jgi:hypothetical protein